MTWLGNRELAEKTSSFLESIFQSVTDAILIVDSQGMVIGANPAARELTGFGTDDLIGKVLFCDICRGIATISEESTCHECFVHKPSVSSFEMKIRTKDGREIPVTASSARLGEAGFNSIVVILRDMSEQYRVERERFQRIMTNYVIQAQEEERKRVSRDLHDGIGQALYSILVGLKVLNQLQLEESVKNHIEDVHQMTARALEEVKSMAVELRPSALDDLGLVPAIRSYLKRFEQTFGIVTEFEVTGNRRRVSSVIETALYRIMQEAMTNAAKYADTDKMHLRLIDTNDKIEMIIKDEGQGFNPNQIRAQGTGLGLYGMKERAHLLGGTVTIQSAPREGTTIHVFVPVNEKGEPLHVDPGTYSR